MDPLLKKAARVGDLNFLKEVASRNPAEYFLAHTPSEEGGGLGGNIFHVAAYYDQGVFFREATKLLPQDVVQRLVFEPNELYQHTPLHTAARKSKCNLSIVKLIKQIYYGSYGVGKPWLVLNQHHKTPLHAALNEDKGNEACALEILSMDVHFESIVIFDEDGNTPLYYALKNGFDQVSEKILTCPRFSAAAAFRAKDVPTPFHLAPYSSEDILRLLFKYFADDINKTDGRGYNVLHQWAEKDDALPCKVLLQDDDFGELRTNIFKQLVCAKENIIMETPLHIAARSKESELAEIMIRGYQQVSVVEPVSADCPPWKIENKYGNTPLHSVMYAKPPRHEDLALKMVSIDPMLCRMRNNLGEGPFFLAVRSGFARLVDEILRIEDPSFDLVRNYNGNTVLHHLSVCPESTGKRLLGKYWWMINLTNDGRKTALDKAKDALKPWLVTLLTNPSRIRKEDFDWVSACQREETQAVLAFIHHCQDLQGECRHVNDTPLHHIKLPTYKDYQDFLKIQSIGELKNTTDHNGATPLHRALERKDMLFAKILLRDDGVDQSIADHEGRTAMDLLAKLCEENDDWENMCKQIRINPYVQIIYIKPWTNLDQIRGSLSIIAAFFATITFAAAFSLPGGVKDDNGQARFATKAAFLVFLLADVSAMCTAILVLFCLIWSMISEPDMARVLVDRSVFILMASLYCTLVACVTGIFTMISKRSLWAAILVFVMCSIIGILAHNTTLLYVTAKLVPSADKKRQHRMRLLEEGNLASSSARNDPTRQRALNQWP